MKNKFLIVLLTPLWLIFCFVAVFGMYAGKWLRIGYFVKEMEDTTFGDILRDLATGFDTLNTRWEKQLGFKHDKHLNI